jgi:ABC-type transport system involved in multi-copper enzyme maturation permease subunit
MRTLSILIKRELLENLASIRYILISILCIALCLTSIILLSSDYENRLKRSNLSQQVHGVSNLFEWEPVVAKPPAPLSVIAKGVDEAMGRPVLPANHPRYHVIGEVFNYYGEEHHLFDLFTTPDFVYIMNIVLSVFAMFLSFDTICGEKETRTLSLLMSNSVSRSAFLLAKWLGGYISLLLSLSSAMLIMVIFLTASSRIPLETEHRVRFAGIIGLSLIHLSVFYTLGMFVSTLTRRSATALVLVLCIWAFWALAVPRVGLLMAQAITPVTPEFVFQSEKVRLAPAPGRDITKQEREELWKADDAYITTIDRQTRMGQHLARFSPVASFLYATTTLAQTGVSDYQDYRQRFFKRVKEYSRQGNSVADRGPLLEAVRKGIFAYQPVALQRSFSEISLDIVLLMLWSVLLFMGAHMAFLRYDVR